MIRTVIDLVCDTPGCGNWVQGSTVKGHSPEVRPTPARMTAKAVGWETARDPRTGAELDYCPECVTRRRNPAPPVSS